MCSVNEANLKTLPATILPPPPFFFKSDFSYKKVFLDTESGLICPKQEGWRDEEKNTVWHEIFAGVYFGGLANFELI